MFIALGCQIIEETIVGKLIIVLSSHVGRRLECETECILELGLIG